MGTLYSYLYETITLRTMGMALGLILVGGYLYAMFSAGAVCAWLKKLPRNRPLGIALLAIDAVWAFVVISHMDLGEFFTIRHTLQLAIPISFVLIMMFADEFLAVRALGVLLLLAATPILEAAFLEEPVTRLLLPILAYVIIIKGLIWVGMPYLMRDAITWATANPKRWRALCSAGAAYGVAILICAFVFY